MARTPILSLSVASARALLPQLERARSFAANLDGLLPEALWRIAHPRLSEILASWSEKLWQAQVLVWAFDAGWYAWHDRDSRQNLAGFPDLVLIPLRGQGPQAVLWRELKRESGTLTPIQAAVHEALRAAGCDVDVWRPSDWQRVRAELGVL